MQTQMTDIDMQESDTSDSILKKKINKKKKSMCRKATPSYEALKWKIFLKNKKIEKEKKEKIDVEESDSNIQYAY